MYEIKTFVWSPSGHSTLVFPTYFQNQKFQKNEGHFRPHRTRRSCSRQSSVPMPNCRIKIPILRCSLPKPQSLWPILILTNLPTLKVACLSSAASAVGCAQTDFACQCSSSQSIRSTALDCILNGCGAVTGRQVFSAAALVLCSCVSIFGRNVAFTSTTFLTTTRQQGSFTYSPPVTSTTA